MEGRCFLVADHRALLKILRSRGHVVWRRSGCRGRWRSPGEWRPAADRLEALPAPQLNPGSGLLELRQLLLQAGVHLPRLRGQEDLEPVRAFSVHGNLPCPHAEGKDGADTASAIRDTGPLPLGPCVVHRRAAGEGRGRPLCTLTALRGLPAPSTCARVDTPRGPPGITLCGLFQGSVQVTSAHAL